MKNELLVSYYDDELQALLPAQSDTKDTQKPVVHMNNTIVRSFKEIDGKIYAYFNTNIYMWDDTKLKDNFDYITNSKIKVTSNAECNTKIIDKTASNEASRIRNYTIESLSEIDKNNFKDIDYSISIDLSGSDNTDDAGNPFANTELQGEAKLTKSDWDNYYIKYLDKKAPVVTMKNIAKYISTENGGDYSKRYATIVADLTITDDYGFDLSKRNLSGQTEAAEYNRKQNVFVTVTSDNSKREVMNPDIEIERIDDFADSDHKQEYKVTIKQLLEEDKLVDGVWKQDDTMSDEIWEYNISVLPTEDGFCDKVGHKLTPYILNKNKKDYEKFKRAIRITNKEIELETEPSEEELGNWEKQHSIKVNLKNEEQANDYTTYIDDNYKYVWLNREDGTILDEGTAKIGEEVSKAGLNGAYYFVCDIGSSYVEDLSKTKPMPVRITSEIERHGDNETRYMYGPVNFDNMVSETERAKLIFKEVGTDNNLFEESDIKEVDIDELLNTTLPISVIKKSINKVYKVPYTNKDIDVSILNGSVTKGKESGFKQAVFIVDLNEKSTSEDGVKTASLTESKTYTIVLSTQDKAGNISNDVYIVEKSTRCNIDTTTIYIKNRFVKIKGYSTISNRTRS